MTTDSMMSVLVKWLNTASTFFFFNDTATTEIYTLSLHDALPIYLGRAGERPVVPAALPARVGDRRSDRAPARDPALRSEEHTSELQSRQYLVCRLLLEKKKKNHRTYYLRITKSVFALRLPAPV